MLQNKIINISGQKLYVEHDNSLKNRPTLVFLHDSLGCIQLWRDFPQKLAIATQCNLLMYDRLGYGKSSPMSTSKRSNNYMELEADILNELLIDLNINNPILFGHSDGGTIALLTASKYPTKIKATIAEAAHIFVEDVTLAGIYQAMDAYKNTNLAERLTKYHGEKVDMLFKAWTETWTSSEYKDWNIEHLLPTITSPLLFIQGEQDEYGTLEQVEKTIALVNGKAEKLIIPSIGHTPHKETPDLILEKVSTYINQLLLNE